MKTSTLLLSLLGCALATAPFACAGEPDYEVNPPTSSGAGGGFDPTGGGLSSGNGSGSGSGAGPISSGVGGMGGSGPPMCADADKRCDHVFTYENASAMSVEIRGDFAPDGWMTGVPMTKVGSTWSATVEIPYNAQVQYKFVVDGNWIQDPANTNEIDDGFGKKNSLLLATTCDPWTCAPQTPPTMGTFDWHDGVMYFVFVDRFLDGSSANNGQPTSGVQPPADFRGGDWAGLKQKIDANYFNDLGVNVLWLTVPMDNTEQSGKATDPNDAHLYSAYHGYWPKNLDMTEEHFGTMADLKAVVDAAHAKKIRVILDYAMNHVHASSPVYQQHQDWFWPNQNNGGNCVCGQGCSWDPPEGERCWFTSYLPDFNFTNAAARKFSVDNAIWWLQQSGADGFRLDAVKHIDISWLYDIRSRVKTDIEPVTGEHVYMVGETFTGDRNLIKKYVNPGSLLDGQFDFPLRMELAEKVLMRKGTMQDFENFMNSNDAYYGSASIMSTFIGNHDIPRSIHLAEDTPVWDNQWTNGADRAWNNTPSLPSNNRPFERMANAFTILFTIPGIPLVYYGDEVGLPGGGDPDNRRMMQWSGYSAGQSLLLNHLKKLGQIRAAQEPLRRGSRASIWSSTHTLAYKMTSGSKVVYVAINRDDSAQQVGGLPGGQLTDLLTNTTVSGTMISVPARSSMILVP